MEHKNKRYFNFILYVIFAIVYLYVVRTYGMGDEKARIRYYILFGITIIGMFTLVIVNWKKIKENGISCLKEKKLLLIFFVALLFYIISVYKANIVNMDLDFRTYIQISLFLLPTIYAFIAINIFSNDEIIRIFKTTTIILIISYFAEPKHSIIEFLNINNWMNVSFVNFSGFTESSLCARSFSALFLVFYYIYKTDKTKNNFLFMIINFIFTVLCFKRLDILVAIFVVLFGRFLKLNKEVKIVKVLIFTGIMTILTILYIEVLNGNLLNNFDVTKFTSNRNGILALWAKKDYLSYGYGTSLLVINKYLELDLIEIYMELNIFALISFIFSYIYFSKNSRYSFFIMLYIIFNMLTASSLANTLAWVIQMVAIAYISNDTIQKKVVNNLENE